MSDFYAMQSALDATMRALDQARCEPPAEHPRHREIEEAQKRLDDLGRLCESFARKYTVRIQCTEGTVEDRSHPVASDGWLVGHFGLSIGLERMSMDGNEREQVAEELEIIVNLLRGET